MLRWRLCNRSIINCRWKYYFPPKRLFSTLRLQGFTTQMTQVGRMGSLQQTVLTYLWICSRKPLYKYDVIFLIGILSKKSTETVTNTQATAITCLPHLFLAAFNQVISDVKELLVLRCDVIKASITPSYIKTGHDPILFSSFLITVHDFISSTTAHVLREVKKWVTNLGRVRTQTSCISGTTWVLPNVCFLARYSVCVRNVRAWMEQVKEDVFPVWMTFHLFFFKTLWWKLHFAPVSIVSLWYICNIQNQRL